MAGSCIVIGGGLAGIAAALRLAEAHWRVTLVETRQRLGGRATSFTDPTTGATLDNCQHVLLGCCTSLLDLYCRLGVSDSIAWHHRLYFQDARGTLDVLEADDLPAPLHLSSAFLRFKQLSVGDKLAIGRATAAMLQMGLTGRKQWHRASFADWLAQQRQPASAVRKYWQNIAVGALNETPERMAADYALQVFQEGFLASERASAMGLSAVPLVRLYDAAVPVLEQAGGQVLLSRSAERLLFDGAQITGLQLADGEILTADAYVSAVPFDRLAKLCPPQLCAADARLQKLDELTVSPIIGIHVCFAAAQVMDLPHLVLTESNVHWIFNKGMDDAGGQHLHGVISAAHELVDQPTQHIGELVVDAMRQALPKARRAPVRHVRVVKEKRATFSIRPGSDALRPDAAGAVKNLLLAGDWCNSGWPATMEGAVRSGYRAAGALLHPDQPTTCALPPELPPSELFQLLAGS